MANSVNVVTTDRKYKTVLTAIGNSKIAQAALNGTKVNITTAVIGDGGGGREVEVSEATTGVIGEVWRGEIDKKEIDPTSSNMVNVKISLDATVGGFTITNIVLLDDEGDCIVAANTPPTPKVVLADGIDEPLTIVLHVLFTNADVVEFTVKEGDAVDPETLQAALAQHNADPNAHNGSVGGASAVKVEVTIPTEGWTLNTDPDEGSGLHVDIPVEGMTADMTPFLHVYPKSMNAARNCGITSAPVTIAGALRVYAALVPAEEIHASLSLLGSAGSIVSGGVTVTNTGAGLVNTNGTLAVNFATGADVQTLFQ